MRWRFWQIFFYSSFDTSFSRAVLISNTASVFDSTPLVDTSTGFPLCDVKQAVLCWEGESYGRASEQRQTFQTAGYHRPLPRPIVSAV
eukprot:525880-Hanusia_phi.AAC.1